MFSANFIRLAAILAAGVALTGCDLVKAPKSVNEMNDKMNSLSSNMDAMNTKMDATVAGINSTNNAVHDQQIVLPYEALLKPEYTRDLDPIPADMMPFGKKLAEAATREELIALTYLWLKKIDEVFPVRAVERLPDGKPSLDPDGNTKPIPFTQAEIERIQREKEIRLKGLMVIAGFTPQSIVEEIVQKDVLRKVAGMSLSQRQKAGLKRQTAYKFLMLRAQFLEEVLLKSSALTSLRDVGEFETALMYNEQLDFITKLPFADHIAYRTKLADAQFTGMDWEALLDKRAAFKIWRSINAAFDVDLKIGGQTLTGDPVRDDELFARERAEALAMRAKVEAYIASYR